MKKAEKMADLTPEEIKKKQEEEEREKMAHKGGKNPYPEKSQKLNEGPEKLSRSTETLTPKNELNRFQELSDENRETNQEFLDIMLQNQGASRARGAK